MTKNSSQRIVLYAADGTAVRAILFIKTIYSPPTQDGPAEPIGKSATCRLEDGSPLNRIDRDTFESLTGERYSRIKPG